MIESGYYLVPEFFKAKVTSLISNFRAGYWKSSSGFIYNWC